MSHPSPSTNHSSSTSHFSPTLRLLRLPFSFFLMPVYWFALSQVVDRDWTRAILIQMTIAITAFIP